MDCTVHYKITLANVLNSAKLGIGKIIINNNNFIFFKI